MFMEASFCFFEVSIRQTPLFWEDSLFILSSGQLCCKLFAFKHFFEETVIQPGAVCATKLI